MNIIKIDFHFSLKKNFLKVNALMKRENYYPVTPWIYIESRIYYSHLIQMEQRSVMEFMVCCWKPGKSTLPKQVPNDQQVGPGKLFQIIKYLKENPCRIQEIKVWVGLFCRCLYKHFYNYSICVIETKLLAWVVSSVFTIFNEQFSISFYILLG